MPPALSKVSLNYDIISWNCNGLLSKLDSITYYLTSSSPALLIVQETHPQSILPRLTSIKSSPSDLIRVPGYSFIHAPHPTLSNLYPPSATSLFHRRHLPSGPHPDDDPSLADTNYDGIGFFIRDDLNFTFDSPHVSPFSTSSISSNQICFVHILSFNLIVGSLYFHPSSSSASIHPISSKIDSFIEHHTNTSTPYLILGDMNAHHPSWSLSPTHSSNAAGLYINGITDPHSDSPLLLLNSLHCPFTPTFTRLRSNDSPVQSIIDLAIAPAHNLIIDSLTIESTIPLNSDHFPLLIKCNNAYHPSPPSNTSSLTRLKFRFMNPPSTSSSDHYKANYNLQWKEYKSYLSFLLTSDWLATYPSSSSLSSTSTINSACSSLIELIIDAATYAFRISTKPPKHNYWFKCPEVRSAIQQYHAAYRYLQRHPSPNAVKDARDLRHAMRKTIRSTKNNNWNAFIEQLHDNKSLNWQVWKKSKGNSSSSINNICDSNNNPPTSIKQSLNNMQQHYSRISDVSNEPMSRSTLDAINSIPFSDPTHPIFSSDNPDNNPQFEFKQVAAACKSIKTSKAFGPDNIHPRLIKQGGKTLFNCIHILFNAMLSLGHVPPIFKRAWIISLYKSKSKSDPNNYRPISLTSVLIRLLERLIKPKLVSIISPHLHCLQFGFRTRHTTYDSIFLLQHLVNSYLSTNSKIRLPVAFLDLIKAFDRVDIPSLLFKLFKIGVKGSLLLFLHSFLTNRKASSTNTSYSDFSDESDMISGVPQGSVLAPILFLVFINDLLLRIQNETKCVVLAFADDLVLIPDDVGLLNILQNNPNGPIPNALVTSVNKLFVPSLQTALNICTTWGKQWRMKFSLSKSNVVMFGAPSAARTSSFPTFQLCDSTLPYSKSYNYLGLTFSSDNKWSDQASKVINKATTTSYLISRLINSSTSFKAVMKLVTAVTKSIVAYALPFWSPSPPVFNKLNSIMAQPFRRLLALPLSTHVSSILHETGLRSSRVLHEQELLTVAMRLLKSPNPIISSMAKTAFSANPSPPSTQHSFSSGLVSFLNNSPIISKWLGPNYSSHRNSILTSNFSSYDYKILLSNNLQLRNMHFYLHQSSASTNIINEFTLAAPPIPFNNSFVKPKSSTSYTFLNTAPYLLHDLPSSIKFRSRLRFNRALLNTMKFARHQSDHPMCDQCDQQVEQTLYHVINICPAFNSHRTQLKHILRLNPVRIRPSTINDNFFRLVLGEGSSSFSKSKPALNKFFSATSSFLSQIHSLLKY
jgi:hypothetical protein